ncbi:class I adenylate-forming enzyme family protein [Fontivita pretiosa]|uniref:class I adenylate-forming enzyme family protein n=1 Tax=Fontivita pretiosa TaxID=2989684 RepID=UPI003D17BCFC
MQLLDRLAGHAQDRGATTAYRMASPEQDAAMPQLSWRQLHDAVRVWRDRLLHDAHLGPGETILICSPNRLEMPIAILAGLAAGLRVLPVGPELSAAELKRLAEHSSAVAMIGTESAIELMADNIPTVWNIDQISGSNRASSPTHGIGPARSSAARITDSSRTAARGAAARAGLLLQSSGTTGLPKLVLRSGRSLDAAAMAIVRSVGFTEHDRVLATLPLSHSYGLEHGLLAPVWAGSTVVLGRGLDLSVIAPELACGATIFPAVPSIIEMLADLAGPPPAMPQIRRIYSAGAPLPTGIYEAFLGRYGLRVSQLYGATEVGSVTFNDPQQPDFDPASVGQAMHGVSIRILDPAAEADARICTAHRTLAPGEQGQIAVRAVSMFDGYLNEPTTLCDGYFLTGDLGRLDAAGRLSITGRLKLLIDVGGMKVNPLEVESVLCEHPDVQACVVVPIRQSQTVCRLKAIAMPRDPSHPPSIQSLRELARQRLARYKVPRVFEIRRWLPRSPTGKVLRHLVDATPTTEET